MTPFRIARKFSDALDAEDSTLITDTIQELVDHELEDVAAELCRRVFATEQDSDRVLGGDGLGLSPLVTFTLEELRRVVSAPGWTLAMRRERASEALGLFGF